MHIYTYTNTCQATVITSSKKTHGHRHPALATMVCDLRAVAPRSDDSCRKKRRGCVVCDVAVLRVGRHEPA